jgi:hypothetical protein
MFQYILMMWENDLKKLRLINKNWLIKRNKKDFAPLKKEGIDFLQKSIKEVQLIMIRIKEGNFKKKYLKLFKYFKEFKLDFKNKNKSLKSN